MQCFVGTANEAVELSCAVRKMLALFGRGWRGLLAQQDLAANCVFYCESSKFHRMSACNL